MRELDGPFERTGIPMEYCYDFQERKINTAQMKDFIHFVVDN